MTKVLLLQTDMMTRAELAFSALDKNKKGYITTKELMKLTKKLSKEELMNLMAKVIVRKPNTIKQNNQLIFPA
jgi:Ca2+-binding EF-hand superfamily protein